MNALGPCPASPNCVSSLSPDPAHYIAPLEYTGTPTEAKAHLRSLLRTMPRTHIVTDDGHYLHAECRSRIFGFVDDLEFLIDESRRIIHVRSASRTGYWDFGVNRKRVETLRAGFSLVSAHRPWSP